MTPIALYSSDTNRKAALTKAKVWIFASVLAFAFTPFGLLLAVPMFGVGVWFGGPELGARGSRRPSFNADEDGFSADQKLCVTDRHRLDWDEFIGVEVRTVEFGRYLQLHVLVVKTANHGEHKIRQPMMSGTPEDMAQEIGAYAKHAQRKACLIEALANLPMEQLVEQPARNSGFAGHALGRTTARIGAATRATRYTKAPFALFQRVPAFSARIFGRRKVI